MLAEILEHDRLYPVVPGRKLRQQPLGALLALVVADHDARTLLRERPHGRGADAVAASDDDRDLAFHHDSFCISSASSASSSGAVQAS